MNTKRNQYLTANAQKLRREMTREERHLWYDFLKTLLVPVKRQKIFGNYIVDFYIASANLAIELDGSQHYEDANQSKDAQRDDYLKRQGIVVLRYPNAEVNQNFRAVCEDIWAHAAQRLPLEGKLSPQVTDEV